MRVGLSSSPSAQGSPILTLCSHLEYNKSSISGTTAHVGVSLHGSESRSGHRHLDRVGAFARNSLDIFHIATDSSLGNLLKIRVWHDNKGASLTPAGFITRVSVSLFLSLCQSV